MKQSFLGLRTCIYKVSDIEKAKTWYSSILDIEPYFDEPFYVGYNVAGFELGLQPDAKNEAKVDGVITYWGVNDVQEVFQNLLSGGAKSYEEPNEVGGGIIVAAVKDPWDNVFGIIYNPHFSLA
jgi:predicted enzyme related to lactoylglutathione lyase